ncbi:ABC transporter substrate-binding protein [Frigidibacter sp. MR17.14]|uniref:ABC transporter substrate-binding protein n=1 Tax=Frigidibacter sp. MR17.14 TaxID=3126509 RepID=UPI003012AEE8
MKARLTLTCAVLALAVPAWAQDVAPEHADAWAFMQEAMPGVPYDLLAAACKEGTVMIYNGTWGDAQKNQIAAFSKRFPCVNVTNFELPTSERRERFVIESKAGRHTADIVQDTDPGVLDAQSDEGLILEYKISSDAQFADSLKKSGYWYPVRIALAANAWNLDNVTDEEIELLSTWQGMTDPRFKGRVGIAMSPSGGGGVTLYPYYALYKTYGEDFMKAFAALEPRNFSGANTLAGALASGDIDVALAVSETGIIPLQGQGAPIEWSLPEPGMGLATGQGISANAPHPNAARLYQEYAFSDEGYAAFNLYGGAPAKTGFADTRPVAKEEWYEYPKTFSDVDPRLMITEKTEFLALNNAWFGLK